MALKTKKGTFTVPATTGNVVVDTGLGEAVRLLILWGQPGTTEGFAAGNRGFHSFITGTGTEQVCLAWASDDNAGTANVGRRLAEAAIALLSDGTPTLDAEASFSSFGAGGDAGKFTVNVSDAPAASFTVHYLALAGDGILNAKVVKKNLSTGTGTEAETGAGFQPTHAFAIPTSTGSGASVPRNESNVYHVGFGATDGTTEFGAGFAEDDAGASANVVVNDEAAFVAVMQAGVANVDAVATLSSFDADGLTVTKSDDPRTQEHIYYALLELDTGHFADVFTETTKTSTGTKDTTGLTGQPSGVLFWAVDNTGAFVIGGADGTDEGYGWWETVDASSPTDTNRRASTGGVLAFATSPSTLDDEATLDSFLANGIRLDYTTADATARSFGGVAFGPDGDTAAPGDGALAVAWNADGELRLTDTAPADVDLQDYRLVRKVGGDPADETDGTLVRDWTGVSPSASVQVDDAGLTVGTRYHYGIFYRDTGLNVSAGSFADEVATNQPAIVSPADGSELEAQAPLVVDTPNGIGEDARPYHFHFQLATDSGFTAGLMEADTTSSPTDVEYESSAGVWAAIPSTGLAVADRGKRVRWTPSPAVTAVDTYYWRVRVKHA